MKRFKSPIAVLLIAVVCMFGVLQGGLAQWAGVPPSFVQGPTLAATVRNAIQAASDQARVTAKTAADMGARARGAEYQKQNFQADYQNLLFQFHNLRSTANALASLVAQGQSDRAANAAAELVAGLNIIAEAFDPMQQELQEGTINHDTIVRMCQVLNEALREWDRELIKDKARLGTVR